MSTLISGTLLALAARLALAAIFLLLGRTKVDGLLTVNDSAYTLFREEYKVPLLPPEFATHMATYAEHLFPLLADSSVSDNLLSVGGTDIRDETIRYFSDGFVVSKHHCDPASPSFRTRSPHLRASAVRYC